MESVLEFWTDMLIPPSVILVVMGSWILAEDALDLPAIFRRRAREIDERLDRLEGKSPTRGEEARLKEAVDQAERLIYGAALLMAGLGLQALRALNTAFVQLGLYELALGLAVTLGVLVGARRAKESAGQGMRNLAGRIARTLGRVEELESGE